MRIITSEYNQNVNFYYDRYPDLRFRLRTWNNQFIEMIIKHRLTGQIFTIQPMTYSLMLRHYEDDSECEQMDYVGCQQCESMFSVIKYILQETKIRSSFDE